MSTTTTARPAASPSRGRGWSAGPAVALVGITVCLWVPTLSAPLTSDEGGFLMVGGQWHAGTSLYGDYWVDRPPLLIALFGVVHLLGGAIPLRLLGLLCATASIVLSQAVGTRITGSRRAGMAAAVVTTALLGTPLFDSFQVDGELLALPWVYAGLLAVCSAYSRDGESARAAPYWAAAGAAGAVAALIKQDFIDVFVFVAALLLCARLVRRRSSTEVLLAGASVMAGAAAVGLSALALAASRGTTGPELVDALVTFRAEAGQVIADSASAATHARFVSLSWALLASGGLVLGALSLVLPLRRPVRPGVVAVAAMLAWQMIGVLAGGSYWLHYLVGVIPGLALGSALSTHSTGLLGRLARLTVGYVATAAVVALVVSVMHPQAAARTTLVGQWLAGAAEPGDTGTVLYGAPNILQAAGVSSPYPELWSLPVRVRDPALTQLTAVLDGARAPTWLVVDGGLGSWGIDPTSAEVAVAEHYRLVDDVSGYRIFLHDGVARELP